MRIAYFVGPYPRYSETFVLQQLRAMLTAGHDVCVFAETAVEAIHGAPPAPIHRLEEMPGQPLRRVVELLQAIFSGRVRPSWTLLRSFNIFRYGLDALSLRLPWSVWRAGKNAPFDLLYAHFGACGRRAALLRATGALQGKLITVMHGDDISGYPRRSRGNIYAPLFATGDLFLAVSEYGKRKMQALGCPGDRILVQRMGVDSSRFVPAAHAPSKLRIVTVARFVGYKGLSTAIAALARLNRPFQYELIGDGPLKTALVQQVEDLGLATQVTFSGARPASAVIQALQSADLFCLPSETQANGDEEGIPVAIMEAMACGLPVISTRHSGIPELIDDGVEGFLVAERDTAALAAAIEKLANSPELRERMGRAGRERILRQYDSATLDKHLLRTLEELL